MSRCKTALLQAFDFLADRTNSRDYGTMCRLPVTKRYVVGGRRWYRALVSSMSLLRWGLSACIRVRENSFFPIYWYKLTESITISILNK